MKNFVVRFIPSPDYSELYGRVFCVLNDRTANNLINILKENVATNENQDMDLDEEFLENTRVFSD